MPKNQTASYLGATGEIPYSLTNDYMFHAVLQENKNTLKGLLSALLHLKPEDIADIIIRNPITPGKSVTEKEFILDMKLIINKNTLINLEIQVINRHDWPERSLAYLCRTYDQLQHGEEYAAALPAIHIGILDFQPFENNIEFYATYQLLNVKNHHLYSSKFSVNVLDLTHINLATEEDRLYEIDRWARLFKATTWEEIKMIAKNNESMNNVAQLLYEFNADLEIRDQCYARNLRLRDERKAAETAKMNQILIKTISEKDAALAEQAAALAEKDAALSEKDAEIARLKAQLNPK